MARPKKNGADYFPFDVNFFSDSKVQILKARYGTDGIALYLYILCKIYKDGYYVRYDADLEYIAALELDISIEKVKQITTFLFSRSLLTKLSILVIPDTIVTSRGIQRRYQEIVKTRALKTPIAVDGSFWLLKPEETEPFIKVTHNDSFSKNNDSFSKKNPSKSEINDIKERKGKERKEKSVEKSTRAHTISDSEYSIMVKKYGKEKTDYYVERTKKYKCCNIQTIEKWISEDIEKKSTAFSNFNERQQDYDALQSQLVRKNFKQDDG